MVRDVVLAHPVRSERTELGTQRTEIPQETAVECGEGAANEVVFAAEVGEERVGVLEEGDGN